MSLRDQPYMPVYVQDILTDEKLMECSANAHGVYFRLMLSLHKQENYGVICLKEKDKKVSNNIQNFALKLAKSMPFSAEIIADALQELIEEAVLICQDECLYQKRMVKDEKISVARAAAGKTGGKNKSTKQKSSKSSSKLKTKPESKTKQNTEGENENDTVNVIDNEKELGKSENLSKPEQHCLEGTPPFLAVRNGWFEWHDTNNLPQPTVGQWDSKKYEWIASRISQRLQQNWESPSYENVKKGMLAMLSAAKRHPYWKDKISLANIQERFDDIYNLQIKKNELLTKTPFDN